MTGRRFVGFVSSVAPLQRVLTTREPRAEHLDLASMALLGVIEAESASLHYGKVQPRPGNQPNRRSPS